MGVDLSSHDDEMVSGPGWHLTADGRYVDKREAEAYRHRTSGYPKGAACASTEGPLADLPFVLVDDERAALAAELERVRAARLRDVAELRDEVRGLKDEVSLQVRVNERLRAELVKAREQMGRMADRLMDPPVVVADPRADASNNTHTGAADPTDWEAMDAWGGVLALVALAVFVAGMVTGAALWAWLS